jgi:hypothetical protein
MQQATTVRVPASDRVHPLEEWLLGWLATPAISAKGPSAGHQGQTECIYRHLYSHAMLSPIRLGRHRWPGLHEAQRLGNASAGG